MMQPEWFRYFSDAFIAKRRETAFLVSFLIFVLCYVFRYLHYAEVCFCCLTTPGKQLKGKVRHV
ncbi:hypothetical protein D6C13_09720 [Rahnella woolbedingensis]|uniref:Uncharacterized protein n=1 Tax=Rahnella woolbedingensis TaxID=1510574 RepID=A0A419NAE9_9GAMM|nr:hypothetical protein D6C13_09720 [Rahnella woolbedingensis]